MFVKHVQLALLTADNSSMKLNSTTNKKSETNPLLEAWNCFMAPHRLIYPKQISRSTLESSQYPPRDFYLFSRMKKAIGDEHFEDDDG